MPLQNPGISDLEIARKRAGLTAAELAAAIGVSAAHISQIERGWRTPSTRVKERAAAVLQKPVADLFPSSVVPALLRSRGGQASQPGESRCGGDVEATQPEVSR